MYEGIFVCDCDKCHWPGNARDMIWIRTNAKGEIYISVFAEGQDPVGAATFVLPPTWKLDNTSIKQDIRSKTLDNTSNLPAQGEG
jgi:hypothetical protein